VDSATYATAATVTVAGNTGSLAKTGYAFVSWNTAADGGGTAYLPGATFAMGSSSVTLYAQWEKLYSVTYDANGGSGNVPTDSTEYHAGGVVTVAGNTGSLSKSGCSFTGWNTKADGTGTNYAQGATFKIMNASVTLYARWTSLPTYAVTYDKNGGTGTPPVDTTNYLSGATVTVAGNTDLAKAGYSFVGWNTKAGGTGTTYAVNATFAMGSENVILYAQWTALPIHTITYAGSNADSGEVPAGASCYEGQAVTVADNTGNLVKAGYAFDGWKDASGTAYAANSGFYMGTSDVTLSAVWKSTTGGASIGVTVQGEVHVTLTLASAMIAQGAGLTATASPDSAVDSYSWYLDGSVVGGQVKGSFTGGASLNCGTHTIMVMVWKNGVPYSTSVGFTVQ
jgi:uncharacterized repeat protein (TIGR02543 family)